MCRWWLLVATFDRTPVTKVDIYQSVPASSASSSLTLPAARLPHVPAVVFQHQIFLGCESAVASDMGDILSVDIADISNRFHRKPFA